MDSNRELLKARIASIADADQSQAIIDEYLKQAFLADPEAIIAQWVDLFDESVGVTHDSTLEAAVHWHGVVAVRQRIFNLIESNCWLADDENGDIE